MTLLRLALASVVLGGASVGAVQWKIASSDGDGAVGGGSRLLGTSASVTSSSEKGKRHAPIERRLGKADKGDAKAKKVPSAEAQKAKEPKAKKAIATALAASSAKPTTTGPVLWPESKPNAKGSKSSAGQSENEDAEATEVDDVTQTIGYAYSDIFATPHLDKDDITPFPTPTPKDAGGGIHITVVSSELLAADDGNSTNIDAISSDGPTWSSTMVPTRSPTASPTEIVLQLEDDFVEGAMNEDLDIPLLKNDIIRGETTGGLAIPPEHGSIVAPSADGLMYRPDENWCGHDSFRYEITTAELTDTANVTIVIVCPDPVAIDLALVGSKMSEGVEGVHLANERSSTSKIGLGFAAAVAGLASVGALAFVIKRRETKGEERRSDESSDGSGPRLKTVGTDNTADRSESETSSLNYSTSGDEASSPANSGILSATSISGDILSIATAMLRGAVPPRNREASSCGSASPISPPGLATSPLGSPMAFYAPTPANSPFFVAAASESKESDVADQYI